jgi:hypothetical protein
MDESGLEHAQETLEGLLPDMKLDGLEISSVNFDFYSESVDAVFAWNGKKAKVRFPSERMQELEEGSKFAAKHLRDQLYKTFGVQED